jgi:hypothetical protein
MQMRSGHSAGQGRAGDQPSSARRPASVILGNLGLPPTHPHGLAVRRGEPVVDQPRSFERPALFSAEGDAAVGMVLPIPTPSHAAGGTAAAACLISHHASSASARLIFVLPSGRNPRTLKVTSLAVIASLRM